MVKGIDPQYDRYAALRDTMLAKPRATVWLLAGVSLVVLIVALVGIMGLTSYWVQQRTRQIGVRRALGARRAAYTAGRAVGKPAGGRRGYRARYGVGLR